MIAGLLSQRRAVNVLFVVICGLGVLSLNQLGREELPEFAEAGISISAILPGGSPEEVDLKVARPLQNAIKDLSGVKEIASQSAEGRLSISVTFDVEDGEAEALSREIAQIVNQVPDLPVELEGPYVSRRHSRIFPALTILFNGGEDLQRHIHWHRIQLALEQMPEVDALEVLGDRKRRAEIRLNPLALERYGLRIDQVGRAVSQGLADRAAGRVEAPLALNRIRMLALPDSLSGLNEVMVDTTGGGVRLSELGEVRDALEPARVRVSYHGESAWYINLYRRSGTNIEDLAERVRALVKRENSGFNTSGHPFRLAVLYDRSEVVERNLGTLIQSVALGIALVMLVLWLFLGAKHAVFAAIGIPFAFLVTFLAMDWMGMSLNMLTLFGLVLVCGMIVDDAIVVLENVRRYQQDGVPHAVAISRGVREVLPAVVASTFTTVAALLPLLLMTGGMGMYISQIPQVAILALLASLAECLIILPVHLFHAQNPGMPPLLSGLMDRAAGGFAAFSAGLLVRPYLTMGAFGILVITTFTIGWWRMDFELFESDETRTIRFYLEFENGTDLDTAFKLTQYGARQIETTRPEIRDVVVLAGWRDYNYVRDTGSRFATLELQLADGTLTNANARTLADSLDSELRNLPGLERLDQSTSTNAPPTGVPVQIYLYGENADALGVASSRVREALTAIPSVIYPTNPMEDGVLEDLFRVDRTVAQQYGITPAEIGSLLHAAVTGLEVGRLDQGDEVLDVYVLADRGDKQARQSLNHLRLPDGRMVPLEKLGRFETRFSPNAVQRHQGKRFVSITADIDEEVMSAFKTHRKIERLITAELLPAGVSFKQQGEYSDTQESLSSMIRSALIAVGFSYFVLVLLFRSYLQPVIVLMTIPLAYMGVVWGMTLLGQPLSLMGLIGIIGLIGIVVNDALVWMSFYNREHERIKDAKAAALSAVRLRFRPIWLTTITTVFGLLPTSMAASAGIANAMAKTVVFGLASASLLLLVFLPVCMVVGDDLARRLEGKRRTAPEPEPVPSAISTLESAA